MYYNLSKDYEKLYDLISKGEVIIGFVDFLHEKENLQPSKDVIQIKKIQGIRQIEIYCRGRCYGSVDEYLFDDIPDNKKDTFEKEFFIKICKKNNLEWITNE